MPRFRLSAPARADLASILETSASRWGDKGRQRYARLLAAAMRTIAADPETPPPNFEQWSSVKSVDSLLGRVYKVPFLG